MAMQLWGDFGFAGGFDESADPYQDAQVCINFYPEAVPSDKAKEVVGLLGTPGLIQVAAAPGCAAPGFSNTMTEWPLPSTIQNQPVRGMWVLPGSTQALVVISSACYLATIATYGSQNVAGSLNLKFIGNLNTTSGFVCIRDNNAGGFAAIVDGPFGYFYNIAAQTLSQIVNAAFLGADTVAFIDGWWIFNRPGTQTFYTNTPQYSETFDGTYFALKDAYTDNLMGTIELKEELWLIGEQTTEIWYDAGGPFFPFQRLVGTLMQIGCKAAGSICKIAGGGKEGLIWFGRSERGENIVIKTSGFNWEVVSTVAISNAISNYTTTDDAIAYTYEEGGHSFYVLTFPTADQTWVYDATLPPAYAWHQRLSYDPYSESYHRHRSNCYMNFGGMRIVGDYQNGCLYQLTRAAYTDAGWPILARRRSPFIWNKENRERVFMASLQIDFAPGVGNPSGLGADPVARLRISRDYGTTYGPETLAPMGKTGEYLNRCIYRRLGWSRGAVAQLEVIEPVKRDIVGVTLKAAGP